MSQLEAPLNPPSTDSNDFQFVSSTFHIRRLAQNVDEQTGKEAFGVATTPLANVRCLVVQRSSNLFSTVCVRRLT